MNSDNPTRATNPACLIGPGLLIVAATYGLARYSFGLFLPEFQREFQLGSSALGWIASGSYAGYIIATAAAACMSGRFGPRLPVVLGGIAGAVGMAMIAIAKTPAMLAIGVIIAGTSPGLAYPPLSDAVVRMIDGPRQNRTYTIINSGTSLGVLLAAPVALMAGEHWRLAWAVFVVISVSAAWWNHAVLPTGPFPSRDGRLPDLNLEWYLRPGAGRLFTAALVLGLTTAIYWTFAVDLITSANPLNDNLGQLFWAVLGIAGFGGAVAGDLVNRVGLRFGLRLAVLALAAAMALLAIWPAQTPAIMASAVLFGATFILITGMFGVWSVHAFADRPAAGFGATFLIITLGQMLGPAFSGSGATAFGLPLMFLVSAGTVMSIAFLVPTKDIHSMAERPPATAAEAPISQRTGYTPRTCPAAVAGPDWQEVVPHPHPQTATLEAGGYPRRRRAGPRRAARQYRAMR